MAKAQRKAAANAAKVAARAKQDKRILAARVRMASAARTLARSGTSQATIKAIAQQACQDVAAEQRQKAQAVHSRPLMLLLYRGQATRATTRDRIKVHVQALTSAALGGRGGQGAAARHWKLQGRKFLRGKE